MTPQTPITVGHVGWSPDYKTPKMPPATGTLIARRSAAACSGVLPITELRLGMMARIIHPEYAGEYPNPVQIVMLERTQDGRENIAVAEAGVPGCVDGWKAEHLEIIPNETSAATGSERSAHK